MKRLIMTMVMAAVMSMTVSAQRIDNTIKEARILTDKMVEELNLNNWQREKAYQMNLDYLNGINGRNDIHSQIWSYRNKQIMGILSSSQWQLFKKSSYFYQPISWKKGAYVHNIYARYPNAGHTFGGNRGNKNVATTVPSGRRPEIVARLQQPNYTAYHKNDGKLNRTKLTNTSSRSFGSMKS